MRIRNSGEAKNIPQTVGEFNADSPPMGPSNPPKKITNLNKHPNFKVWMLSGQMK